MALTTTWPITGDGEGGVVFTANQWRTIVSALFTEGVLGSGSFVVSERAAGANMKLDITGGVAAIQGDDASNQGMYLVREDSATTEAVTIDTADPSNPRHDLVGIQVNDPSEGGSAGRESVFAVVKGTAAASPSDPATPDSFLVLARVVVPAAAVSIEDADIEDLRERANLANQAQFGDAAAATPGTLARRTIGSGQVHVGTPTTTTSATTKAYVDTTAAAAVASTGGTLDSGKIRYRKIGDMVSVWTTNVTNGATLPVGFRPSVGVLVPSYGQIAGLGDVTINTSGVINVSPGPATFAVTFQAA